MRTQVGVAIVAAALFLALTVVWVARGLPAAHAADDGAEIAQLKAEIEQLKGRLPSQSHA